MSVNLIKDQSGKCFVEAGCYPYYYLQDGAELENDVWVDKHIFRHVVVRLQQISVNFAIQEERSRVGNILLELSSQRDSPFDECKRFPRGKIFIQLEQDHYNNIIEQITLGASYKERSEERTGGASNASNTNIKPNQSHTTDESDSPLNRSKKTFTSGVLQLANYMSSTHAKSRKTFERDYNLCWVNDGACCAEVRPMTYCEDLINTCEPSIDSPLPGRPKPKQHTAALLKLLIKELSFITQDNEDIFITRLPRCDPGWADARQLSQIPSIEYIMSSGYIILDRTEYASENKEESGAMIYQFDLNDLTIEFVEDELCNEAYLPWNSA